MVRKLSTASESLLRSPGRRPEAQPKKLFAPRAYSAEAAASAAKAGRQLLLCPVRMNNPA